LIGAEQDGKRAGIFREYGVQARLDERSDVLVRPPQLYITLPAHVMVLPLPGWEVNIAIIIASGTGLRLTKQGICFAFIGGVVHMVTRKHKGKTKLLRYSCAYHFYFLTPVLLVTRRIF